MYILLQELEEKKRKLIEQNAKLVVQKSHVDILVYMELPLFLYRLSRMETEVALLEGKLKSQQLKLQKEADEVLLHLLA